MLSLFFFPIAPNIGRENKKLNVLCTHQHFTCKLSMIKNCRKPKLHFDSSRFACVVCCCYSIFYRWWVYVDGNHVVSQQTTSIHDFYVWTGTLGGRQRGEQRGAWVESVQRATPQAPITSRVKSFNMYWSCLQNLFRKTFPEVLSLNWPFFQKENNFAPACPSKDQEIRVLVGLHSSHSPLGPSHPPRQ